MPPDPDLRRTLMRSVILFAIGALAIAGLMPKVMSSVGGAAAPPGAWARAAAVALRERDAARLGIFPRPSDYTGRSSTANGVIRVAPVRLPSLEVSGIR